MTKQMFGDGTDPSIMPTSNKIHAQRDFKRVINRNPQLKEFALHLNGFLRDLRLSQEFKQSSIKGLIEGEILGAIPPERGYATDYIPPSHPLRYQTLSQIYNILRLKDVADIFRKNLVQNIRYDHTDIEHITMQFNTLVSAFEFTLNYFEKQQLAQRPKPESSPPADLGLTGEALALYQQLMEGVPNQAFLFNCDLILMEIEKEEQSCRLFLPLLTAMLDDKNTHRTLKNSDKKAFEDINTLMEKYQQMRSRFTIHMENFETELKRQTTSFKVEAKAEEVKQLPALAQLPQVMAKQEAEMILSPVVIPSAGSTSVEHKAQAHTADEKKGEDALPLSLPPVRKAPSEKKQAETLSEPKTAAPSSRPTTIHEKKDSKAPATSTTGIDAQAPDDHLTQWLMDVSPPRNRRQPSEQDLKQERKKKAKEEKRSKTGTSSAEEEILEERKGLKEIDANEPAKLPLPIFQLTGNYSLFEEIMTATYTGEMEAIQLLIKNRFDGMAYLSHGRWHFAIPHISQNQTNVFTSTLEPLLEEDNQEASSPSTSLKPPLSAATTIHNPHKNKSKRLRPYHVKDIKELFERGGYNLETVKVIKDLHDLKELDR